MLRPWAERLLDLLRPRAGESALDLPCGEGVLAGLLARAVGPSGAVLAVDEDAVALAACEEQALSLHLANLDCATAVAAGLRVDVAGSLFRLAHAADPVATLRTLAGALRPGGRLAVAVWGEASAVPHEAALLATLASVVGRPPRHLTEALALGSPGRLEELAGRSGVEDAEVLRLRDVVRFDGVAHLWAALGGRAALAGDVETLDDTGQTAVLEQLSVRLLPYTVWDGTLVIPVEAAVLVAPRQSGRGA